MKEVFTMAIMSLPVMGCFAAYCKNKLIRKGAAKK